jgi:hypothetical protein
MVSIAKTKSRITRAGIFKESMGARNRGGIGLSYLPARLHRLAEFIPWNQFLGSITFKNTGSEKSDSRARILNFYGPQELISRNKFRQPI